MDNKERAERARQAFDASPHAREDNDAISNLYDLVCDLLHLADWTLLDERETTPEETNGEYVARMGLWHYREELAEEGAERAAAEAEPPRWFAVAVQLDGDELRQYAIEAADEAEARRTALAILPDPDMAVTELHAAPDDAAELDYDQVMPREEQ